MATVADITFAGRLIFVCVDFVCSAGLFVHSNELSQPVPPLGAVGNVGILSGAESNDQVTNKAAGISR